jgi:hypothetical protein
VARIHLLTRRGITAMEGSISLGSLKQLEIFGKTGWGFGAFKFAFKFSMFSNEHSINLLPSIRYGNVPFNFSTSHIYLHHHLNGGKGDSFYQVSKRFRILDTISAYLDAASQFDLDRSSLSDLFLFLYRIFDHMTGASSLRMFATLSIDGAYMPRVRPA